MLPLVCLLVSFPVLARIRTSMPIMLLALCLLLVHPMHGVPMYVRLWSYPCWVLCDDLATMFLLMVILIHVVASSWRQRMGPARMHQPIAWNV